jgi:hypothetical protein
MAWAEGAWQNGLFAGRPIGKSDLSLLHCMVAYISGDESDIAFVNANDDFERLHNMPAFRAYRRNTPHDGTHGEVNGRSFGEVAVARLDWQLKADMKAGAMFVAPSCGLCRDP